MDLSPEELEGNSEGNIFLDDFDSEVSEFEDSNDNDDPPQLLPGCY